MALLLHYTGQDYISRGLLNTTLTPGSTSAIVGGCKTGKGFEFDGTVNSRLTSETALTDNVLAVSVWFKLNVDSVSGNRFPIFSTAIGTSLKLSLEVYDVNRIKFYTYTSDNTFQGIGPAINNTVSANIWYHVYVVLDKINRTMSLYLNGVKLNGRSIPGSLEIVSNTRWFIGYRVDSRQFNGQICNLKVYNHVLSAREIAEDYKSLMLHYKLDKPITDTVYDVSGFKRHITNLTTNTVTLDSKAQVYSASLKNDGTQSLVGTSDLTDLNGLDEGSFSFRVFLTTNTLPDQYVIYNMTDLIGGNGIIFIFRDDVALAYFYGARIQFNYTPTVDAWHHIVLVKTSTQIKVYADGVNIYTVSATTSSKNFSNITSISSPPSGSNPISNGNVQDIRFYATALTEDDIKELYQTRHMVDKDSNCYTYELIEGQTTVGMNKRGQLLCDEIIENEDGVFKIVKSNKTIKTKEIKEI